MRILVDQDIYKFTIDKLKAWGHEQKYAEDELKSFFCVVEPDRYRIRRL